MPVGFSVRCRHIYCEIQKTSGLLCNLGSRRAERVVEFLFAVVHWLLVGRDSKQNALDFLQDRAVQLAGRRDRGKFAEEAYSTAEEKLEAVLVDQLAQVMSAPGGREDEHVAKLTMCR